MKKISFAVFALFVAGFIIWAMLYQSGTIGTGPKVPSGEKLVTRPGEYKWQPLTEKEIPVFYSAVGTVRSREEIDVVSRLMTARVLEVNFRNGDSFKEGDVLIRLEDKDLKAKTDAAAENLKGAESRLEFAQTEHARNEKLIESQSVSRRAFDQSQSALNSAKAEVAMMKHELENAQTNLEYATIKAPFNGIVSERNCDPGDLATPLNTLMRLFNPAKLQLHVPIRENLFRSIKNGERLDVKIESTGKNYSAEIKEIVPSVDPGSRTFLVNACLEGDTAGLMPGMFAKCDIPTGKRKALTVSPDAVIKIGQLEYMNILVGKHVMARQFVRTAPVHGSDELEIISGAKAGDHYIMNSH